VENTKNKIRKKALRLNERRVYEIVIACHHYYRDEANYQRSPKGMKACVHGSVETKAKHITNQGGGAGEKMDIEKACQQKSLE